MQDTFGDLLRQQIKDSGYTIYQIAQKADINRTTLQKTLTNDRLFSPDILSKLLEFLKLTPEAYNKLTTSYTIAQIGAPTYYRRLYVKELISSLKLMDQSTCIAFTANKQTSPFQLPLEETQLISGQYSVLFLLKTLFEHEIYTEDLPFIYLYGLTEKSTLNLIFTLTNLNKSTLNIKHFVHFITNPDSEENCNFNLQLLADLLPFSLSSTANYEVFYTYITSDTTHSSAQVFPYYIILHNYVILLSQDIETATICQKDDFVNYYLEQFLSSITTAYVLIKPRPDPNQFLQHIMAIDQETTHAYCIQYQPCFFGLIDDNWIEALVKPNIPHRKEFCAMVSARVHQFRSIPAYSFFFKPSGLKTFAEKGIIAEFPLALSRTLTLEERYSLLDVLYHYCESASHTIRAINESKFALSSFIYVSIHGKKDIMFTGIDPLSKNLHYTFISECSLYDAFLDYFTSLTEADYVYTLEETLNLIAHYRDTLMPAASDEVYISK